MSSQGLTERLLKATFTLASGKTFVESGSSTVVVEGLRMRAKIEGAGGVQMTTLSLEIFGLSLSIMNQLSTLGMLVTVNDGFIVQRNSVSLEAGDSTGMGEIFSGSITACWTQFTAMPDVSMLVQSQAGLDGAVASTQPTTYGDDVDVATAMGAVAKTMGLTLENNGVDAKLPPSYFSGSPREQANAIAKAAGIRWLVDKKNLAIWPASGARSGDAVVISKATGMVGYPEYTVQGIKVTTLFNPSLKLGAKVQVVSELFDPKNNPQGQPANGIWNIYKLGYDLASKDPKGPWFSHIEASNPTFPTPVASP